MSTIHKLLSFSPVGKKYTILEQDRLTEWNSRTPPKVKSKSILILVAKMVLGLRVVCGKRSRRAAVIHEQVRGAGGASEKSQQVL